MTRAKYCFLLIPALLWSSPAFAGNGCANGCGDGCATAVPCGPQLIYQNVERTIYVPQTTMEARTIQVTQCRAETRERTVTVYKQVAETKNVTQQRTVQVPQQQTRTETYYIPRPVYKDVVENYTVMVPHQETVTLTRTVCKAYPVKMQRTVTVDEGHWEDQVVAAAPACASGGGCGSCGGGCGNCGDCGSCGGGGCGDCAATVDCAPQTVTQRVWVAKPVQKVEYCTMNQYKTEQVPYESTQTVCKPEQRTRTNRVYAGCEQEAHTRNVNYTVCVAQVQTRTVPVTTYTSVPAEQKQTYTVMVPYTVEKQIQVPVCRMVAKTVVCKVPVWVGGCDNCGGCN